MKKLITSVLFGLSLSANAVPILNSANGHYYEAVTGSISWEDAKTAAESSTHGGIAGHLATITSAAEDAWIFNNIAGDGYLLGGTDAASEGTWEWTTGEAFSYTNWHVGEPNNMGGNENYLIYQFGDGTWNDLPNFHNVIRGYIVEYTHPQALAQASVPAPPIVAMLLPALVMIWGRIRQNRRNAQ